MKTIITNDEGYEAAKRAYRNTAEVTEIETHNLAALVVSHGESDPWYQRRLEEVIGDAFRDLTKRSADANGHKVTVIVMKNTESLQALDERAMRRAGWFRAKR